MFDRAFFFFTARVLDDHPEVVGALLRKTRHGHADTLPAKDACQGGGFAAHGRIRRERRVGAVLEMTFRDFLVIRVDDRFQAHCGGRDPGDVLGLDFRRGGFGREVDFVTVRPCCFAHVARRQADRVFRARFQTEEALFDRCPLSARS